MNCVKLYANGWTGKFKQDEQDMQEGDKVAMSLTIDDTFPFC